MKRFDYIDYKTQLKEYVRDLVLVIFFKFIVAVVPWDRCASLCPFVLQDVSAIIDSF